MKKRMILCLDNIVIRFLLAALMATLRTTEPSAHAAVDTHSSRPFVVTYASGRLGCTAMPSCDAARAVAGVASAVWGAEGDATGAFESFQSIANESVLVEEK